MVVRLPIIHVVLGSKLVHESETPMYKSEPSTLAREQLHGLPTHKTSQLWFICTTAKITDVNLKYKLTEASDILMLLAS